ncbi:MAG: glycosyltransferase family 39 protein [Planctomycetaceae bacterium]|nr:glycosyltransferase family 39 protein [Planctomycetaceae bacterium]
MALSRQLSFRCAAWAAATLALVGIGVVALTAGDYGVAWDDWVQTRYGELVLEYFRSAGANRACNEYLDLRFYGPAFELPSAILCQCWPASTIEVRHVLSALVALTAIPGLFFLGRLLGNPWIGVVSALLLLLSPGFYGQAFINTKDIPFAVGFLWSLVALAALFARGRFQWREIVLCGAAIGLTMSVRPGGWMLLAPMYGLTAMFADWQTRTDRQAARQRTLTKQLGLLAVAWIVMVLPWPWAHANPILHPLLAIRMASKFHLVLPVLFEGQVTPSNELPRYYLLKYLLITTPPATLGLAALGLASGIRELAGRPARPRTLVLVVLAAWLLLPLVLFALMRPNAYDGMRHFLFLVPAVATWGALGFTWLWRTFTRPLARGCIVVALAGALATQVNSLVRLHPYQYTYFNCLAGGVGGAAGGYETDYWLTSYKEAIEWIEAQPRSADPRKVRVLVAANENSRWCAAYFAGDRLVIETTLTAGQPGDLPPGIDYYIGTSRADMDRNFPEAEIVHQVGREGATFATVKRPRP